MIPIHAVVEAVHAAAQDVDTNGAPVALHSAPAPAPPSYLVVELPPGTTRYGSLGCPNENAVVRVRLRGVARHKDPKAASRVAQRLTAAVEAHLLARSTDLSGDGWECDTRTHVADAGIDWQGDLANHVVDLDVVVVARPVDPGP
jgi:hypothetical protein